MSLPAVTQSLDAVDPAHHDLYSQTDAGVFVLDIAGDIAGHPTVAPLENAYRKEQDKRKRQGRELEALKGQLTTNGGGVEAKSLAAAMRWPPIGCSCGADRRLVLCRASQPGAIGEWRCAR